MRKRIIILLLIFLAVIAGFINYNARNKNNNPKEVHDLVQKIENDEKDTLKSNYEMLLKRNLKEEKELLDEGYIPEKVYVIQIEPFVKQLEELPNICYLEMEKRYADLVETYLDWLLEDKAMGIEIDEDFYQFLLRENKKMNF